MICTPSELPPEKTLLEIVTPLGPGGLEPSVVTVTRPSGHEPHGLMLLKTSWSMRMFALATVDTMFRVSVKVVLAIVMSCAPRRVPPGIVTPLTVRLLAVAPRLQRDRGAGLGDERDPPGAWRRATWL